MVLHPHLFDTWRKILDEAILHACHVPGYEPHGITLGLRSPREVCTGETVERSLASIPVILKGVDNQLLDVHTPPIASTAFAGCCSLGPSRPLEPAVERRRQPRIPFDHYVPSRNDWLQSQAAVHHKNKDLRRTAEGHVRRRCAD